MINLKDKIILAVKTVIANEASVETEDGKTIGLYLESNDVDHIAEQVADDLSAEESRIKRDTVVEFVRRIKEIYDESDRLYRGYDIIALWSDIIYLAKEYGAEVE